MAWLIIVLITLVISAVTMALGGVMGGIFLLLALNGFSESQATPMIAGYACVVFAANVGVTSLVNWLVVKLFFANSVPLWAIVLISLGITLALLICTPLLIPIVVRSGF